MSEIEVVEISRPTLVPVEIAPPEIGTVIPIPADSGGGGGGSSGPTDYTVTVSAPTNLVQVNHGLNWKPAGINCRDAQGPVEPADVVYPAVGVLEISFGVPFTGTINLS